MTWIELEGAVNVRDLGGLPATDGGTTVAGRLLRSENLQDLTPGDVARLVDEIGVTTVVDLRSTNEVTIEGPAPLDALAGVRRVHHPVLREFLDVSDTVKAALLTEAAGADRERYPDDPMCGHYLGYLENRPEEVTGALRSIATAPGAAIVHCAAGKDRTGVVVALALTAAGVEPEAIVADYAASARADRGDHRAARPLQDVRRRRERRPRPGAHAAHGDDEGIPRAARCPLRRPGGLADRQRVHRRGAQPAPRQAQAGVTAWYGPASSTCTTRS